MNKQRVLVTALAALFVFLTFMNFAHAVPVKDRCGNRDVVLQLMKIMDRAFPSKYSERASFVFNPNTIIAKSYDANLDKITCQAEFSLSFDDIDTKKQPALSKTALDLKGKTIDRLVIYEMQYVSGSEETTFTVHVVGLKQK